MKKLNVNEELMKKLAKKGAAFVLAGTIALGAASATTEGTIPFAVVANAQENNELEAVQLEVQTGLNLYMDDKGFIPKDVNGNETYPFISNGTTYVPVRAISELFNADVKWDSRKNKVTITTKDNEANLTHTIRERNELVTTTITAHKGVKLYINGEECIPKDVNGNVKDIYIVNGTTYVPVRAVSNALGLPIAWSEKTNSVFIGNHKTDGITVENINNYEEFNKMIGNDFLMIARPAMLGYSYQGEKYNIVSSDLLEYKLAVVLLNYEYCSDELLQSLFSECTEKDIYRMIESIYQISGMNERYGPLYDWNLAVINKGVREYLNKLDELFADFSKTRDNSVFIDEVLSYYTDTERDFYYQGASKFLDYYMIETAINTSTAHLLVKEYKDIFRGKLEFGNIRQQSQDSLNEIGSEIYSRSRSKQLTK